MKTKGAKMQRGFTLIELMLLVMVMGLLAVSIYPSIVSIHTRGIETQVVANMHAVQSAVEEYATMTDGLYPQDFSIPVEDTNPMVIGNTISVAGVACGKSAVPGSLLPASLRNPVNKTVGWAFSSIASSIGEPPWAPVTVVPACGGSLDQGSVDYTSAEVSGAAASVGNAKKYVIWGCGVLSTLPIYLREKQ